MERHAIDLNPAFDSSLRLGAGPFTCDSDGPVTLAGEITDDVDVVVDIAVQLIVTEPAIQEVIVAVAEQPIVVRAAEQRARQVMETAEADSRRLKHETEDFLDQRLGSFEILLDKLQKTVGAGRQRLSIGGAVDQTAAVVEEDDPTKGFFDQDH